MEKIALIILLLVFIRSATHAEKRFEFTDDATKAYKSATSLHFQEASLLLSRMKSQDKENLIAYHIENYIDFLSLYLNQNPQEYKKLKANKEERIAKIKAGNPHSPYYLFVQADIRLQWALVALRFGEYVNAFQEISRAHKLLQKNQQKFPDFILNKKDLGILHALVGTIPDNYKWGAKLLGGLKGTIAQGRQEIEQVLQYAHRTDFLFEEETLVLYAFILLDIENKGEKAWKAIQSATWQPTENAMHCFILSTIAMRTGRNDQAIALLESRPKGQGFMPFPMLDWLLGIAKLRRLDQDAGQYLSAFVQHFKGENGIKEAYQKLAWHALLQGDKKSYSLYMKSLLNQGKAETGADKNALQEAKSGLIPDASLLKARLLFDGGYFQKAYQQLQGKTAADFSSAQNQLEYLYRMGRILHGLKRHKEAITYYDKAIEQGRYKPSFYACNAALQTGLIYETLEQIPEARKYYTLCLEINPAEYKSELHQKAKAGISRLK